MKIGLISGSLRKESFNTKILESVKNMLPEGYEGHIVEIGDLPLYNEDIDAGNLPAQYDRFRRELGEMDHFIFATPEYNRAISAAMKNALDVGSRPYGESKWDHKKAGIISSSISGIGGIMANHNLRQSLVFLNVQPMQQPEAYLGFIQESFDENGNMSERTKNYLQNFVNQFVAFVEE